MLLVLFVLVLFVSIGALVLFVSIGACRLRGGRASVTGKLAIKGCRLLQGLEGLKTGVR